ncbi:MAG: hypothetical protein ACFFEF_07225, partial [Candidatus Thorarchaeota archaeon]
TAPISQASYTQNATVTFYYKDIEANIGVYNDTIAGGVYVTLNTSVSWWVVQETAGRFKVLINATDLGSTGEFAFLASFSWINGKPFYENQTLEFTVSITGAGSLLTYSPPEHVPIGDDIVITVEYKDSSTGFGISNASGFVHTSITPLNATPAGPFQYILTNPQLGVFVFTINSTPFWTSGPIFFEIDVSWTDGELPFYPDVNGTIIRAVIREIFTQTLADAPNPGTVPKGDSTYVVIAFYDLDHDNNVLGATITSTWAYGWSYEVLGDGSFNITIQTSGIVATGQVSAQFTFNRSFYQTKTATVYLTIRLISTSGYSTTPDPSIVPVGDTVSVEIVHFDTDHQVNITDGAIATSWAYGWSWVRTPTGSFSITLNTASVPNLLKYTVTFTLSKANYANAVVSIRFEVRAIQTGITASFLTEVVAGSNITVTVTYEDLDHSQGIEGANILTNAPMGTYAWVELGAGQYSITYYLWLQPAGTYSYDITATKSLHNPASMIVDLQLRQVRTELTTDYSIIQVNWSDPISLSVYYDNLDLGGLVDGAIVRATLSGVQYPMISSGSSYDVTIDSSSVKAGTYLITITANKTNFEARIIQVTVVISVLETRFVSLGDVYSFSVVSGESVNVTVYYESLAFGGVLGATVAYSWDYGTGVMASTGQAGYYTAIVDTTDTPVNVYTLYVRANKSNHIEASIYFSLDVGLVETDLTPVGEATLRVVYGEIATLLVNYSNVNLESPVTGATLLFRFGDADYNGTLSESSPGIYNATIYTSQLYSGTFSLYIVATKPGYETGTLSMLLEVERINTIASALNVTLTMIYEQTGEVYFSYHDIHYDLPIENATLEYRWQGGTGLLEEVGNGTYKILLDSTTVTPGVYDVYVTASKSNYMTRTTSCTVQITKIEMEIVVSNYFEVPVGDVLVIPIRVNDISYNRTIEDIDGSVVWALGTPTLEALVGVPGNYTFIIPADTGLGQYDITIIVNKLHHRTISTIITVVVRPIATSLTTLDGNNYVSAVNGQYLQIEIVYTDIDHGLPISGATLYVTQTTGVLEEGDVTITEGALAGHYIISFAVTVSEEFEIAIHASNGQNYQVQNLPLTIVATAPPQDPLMNLIMIGGSAGIIFALIGALLWVKIFSIPKIIRILNKMIKSVSKGKVPEKPECAGRNDLLHDMVNEALAPVGIYKPLDEMPTETIDFKVPETESLLMELASITGLAESDIAAFRTDLTRMKPSERPGFLNEVIKQEKARRAQELAEKQAVDEDATRTVTPEELREVGERLLKMGLPPEQVEEVLESAKDMTRAELETVLEQLDKSLNE